MREDEFVLNKEFLLVSGCWIKKALVRVATDELRHILFQVRLCQTWNSCYSRLEIHCLNREIVVRLWSLAEEIAWALYRLRSWFGAMPIPHFVICYDGKPASPVVEPMLLISEFDRGNFNKIGDKNSDKNKGMNSAMNNVPFSVESSSFILDFNAVMSNLFLGFSGLVNDGWKRIIDEIYEEQRPCFLVSLDFHRNILFNQAAVDLLNSTPEKLLTKSLPKLWVPPSEIQPVEYDLKPPQKLVDFNSLLRQQSTLRSHRFQNWKENAVSGTAEWVEWTDDISYHELPNGGNARKMVVLGWEPVPALVPQS